MGGRGLPKDWSATIQPGTQVTFTQWKARKRQKGKGKVSHINQKGFCFILFAASRLFMLLWNIRAKILWNVEDDCRWSSVPTTSRAQNTLSSPSGWPSIIITTITISSIIIITTIVLITTITISLIILITIRCSTPLSSSAGCLTSSTSSWLLCRWSKYGVRF